MANNLDSRSITLGDTFAQQFKKEGTVEYHVAPDAAWPADEKGYEIHVGSKKGKGDPETHYVTVRLVDRQLTAEPPTLEITAGDVVMWCPADSATPGFQICGGGPQGTVSSAEMTGGCLYSHAFGVAGTYAWRDPYGSGISGEVVVRDPKIESEVDRAACRKSLGEGKVVLIRGEKAEPAKVEVMTGQTVFWAVEKAKGVAVADSRLAS
jgi:plastocyanin